MKLDEQGSLCGAQAGLIIATAIAAKIISDNAHETNFNPDIDPHFGFWAIMVMLSGVLGAIIGGLTGHPCRDEYVEEIPKRRSRRLRFR